MTFTPTADVGVVVGRFQTHTPHIGHREVLDAVYTTHPQTIIVLGLSATKGTRTNPLDFESRRRMLAELYPNASILPIADQPGEPDVSNLLWSKELDRLVNSIRTPAQSVCLYGGRDSFIASYVTKTYPTQVLEPTTYVSGTEIRKSISKKVMNSVEFRAGAIWQACNQYEKVHPTVDVAILDTARVNVLLVRKHKEPQWRFPGGFVSPSDPSFEAAARREVHEELSGLEITDLQYLGSHRVDDWRYRREDDKITTVLFATTVMYGAAKPSDDVAYAKWCPLTTELTKEMVPEHRPLLALVLQTAAKER